MVMWPVSPKLNSPKNDSPDLLDKFEEPAVEGEPVERANEGEAGRVVGRELERRPVSEAQGAFLQALDLQLSAAPELDKESAFRRDRHCARDCHHFAPSMSARSIKRSATISFF